MKGLVGVIEDRPEVAECVVVPPVAEGGGPPREVRGREHWLSLRPEGLTMAQQWINEQTDFWSTRADALSARLRRKRRPR